MKHGVTVLATGAKEYKPQEYLYGQHAAVFTHLEPKEDPRSWEDEGLDRLDVKKPTD